MVYPPSANNALPVMKLAMGLAKNTTVSAISTGCAILFIGVFATSPAMAPAIDAASRSGVSTYPGQMALIRIFWGAYQAASWGLC